MLTTTLTIWKKDLTIEIKADCPELEAHDAAWKHFWPEGNGQAKPGYALHHIDPSWKHDDPKRYGEWRVEDLKMVTVSEHSQIHGKLNNKGKKTWTCLWDPSFPSSDFESKMSVDCPGIGWVHGKKSKEMEDAYIIAFEAYCDIEKKLKEADKDISKQELHEQTVHAVHKLLNSATYEELLEIWKKAMQVVPNKLVGKVPSLKINNFYALFESAVLLPSRHFFQKCSK